MIEYSKCAADNPKRIRDLTWMNGRFFLIGAICVLPFCLYFFFAGIVTGAAAAMKLGLQTLTLLAVLLAIFGILRNKVKKAVIGNFYEYEIDGKIDFTIDKIDEETLEFTRLTDEVSFQITKADIKCIKYLKYIDVIILKDKRTIDLPKRADIEALIRF